MQVFLLLILLIISLYRYYNEINTELSKESLFITCLTLIVSLLIFITKKENNTYLKANVFKISTFILISIIIVHFFEYIAFIIGEHQYIIGIEYINIYCINEAAIFSLCCTIVILLGYILAKTSSVKYSYTLNLERIRFPEILQFLSVVVFFLFTDKRYFQGGYGEIMNSTGLSLFSVLSQNVIWSSQLASIVLRIYKYDAVSFKEYMSSFSILFYISLLFYYILVIYSGDRGPLIYMSIAWISGYIIINKVKISKYVFVVFIIISAFILSFMGTFRNFEGDISFEKINEVYTYRNQRFEGHNSVFSNTAELSDVVRSYHILYYYRNTYEDDLYWGVGILDQILGVIPGLRFFLYPLLGVSSYSTAALVTKYTFSSFGMGTTCFGDIYYNLGFFGSILFFFLFGIALRKMDIALYNRDNGNIYFFVLAISYLSMGIYIGRASCFVPINLFSYCCCILYLICDIKRSV